MTVFHIFYFESATGSKYLSLPSRSKVMSPPLPRFMGSSTALVNKHARRVKRVKHVKHICYKTCPPVNKQNCFILRCFFNLRASLKLLLHCKKILKKSGEGGDPSRTLQVECIHQSVSHISCLTEIGWWGRRIRALTELQIWEF